LRAKGWGLLRGTPIPTRRGRCRKEFWGSAKARYYKRERSTPKRKSSGSFGGGITCTSGRGRGGTKKFGTHLLYRGLVTLITETKNVRSSHTNLLALLYGERKKGKNLE